MLYTISPDDELKDDELKAAVLERRDGNARLAGDAAKGDRHWYRVAAVA
jgi:hypothetical protein